MSDTITVYRVGDTPLELDPSQCVFTDRTRMETNACPKKRWVEYEEGGRGFSPSGRNDDLRLGSAVHEGIDLMMQGGALEKCLRVAELDWLAEPHYGKLPLEQQDILLMDGLYMIKAFIYGFYHNYLPTILEEYEVVAVEEEINWLLLPDYDQDPKGGIVVMSRPDNVWRNLKTGRLWHISHKTLGWKFDDTQLDKLATDIQRFSEGYAIWARYGERIEGTLYNYFLKGEKRYDEETGLKRYTSGLIHPYMNRLTMTGGEPTSEDLSYVYEWEELDMKSQTLKKKRLGKGWDRVDIYTEMDYLEYLRMLNAKEISRQGRNYLAEQFACLVPIPWELNHAERWRIGAAEKESTWAYKVDHLNKLRDEVTYDYSFAQEITLGEKECFSYNKKCFLYDQCWRGVPLDHLISTGAVTPRQPNHLVELRRSK